MRLILLHVEDGDMDEAHDGWMWARNDPFFVESDRYQVTLLRQAGFMEATDPLLGSGMIFDRLRITNAGHDYLDAIRSDPVWQRTKEAAQSIGGATLEIIKELAVACLKQIARERLGLPL
jgi:hypothetical protein